MTYAGSDNHLDHTWPDLYRVDLDTGAAQIAAPGSEILDGWAVDDVAGEAGDAGGVGEIDRHKAGFEGPGGLAAGFLQHVGQDQPGAGGGTGLGDGAADAAGGTGDEDGAVGEDLGCGHGGCRVSASRGGCSAGFGTRSGPPPHT